MSNFQKKKKQSSEYKRACIIVSKRTNSTTLNYFVPYKYGV